MGFVFVFLLIWGGMEGWEGVKGWEQGASSLDFVLSMFLSIFLVAFSLNALFELFTTRKLIIGPDKVIHRYNSPLTKGEWQASYQEYTSLE